MICPNKKCKKLLTRVRVYSECWQLATLKKGTNEIENYGRVKEITETTGIECPDCGADLIKKIDYHD